MTLERSDGTAIPYLGPHGGVILDPDTSRAGRSAQDRQRFSARLSCLID